MTLEYSTTPPCIILGIDPGTQVTGYGLLKVVGSKITPLDFGCIRPHKKAELPQKYLMIFEALEQLIEKFSPTAVAVETQFVQKNVSVAMKLGMARGMVVLAAARKKIPLFEYAPRKAKQAVVGHGGASKQQVQKMMQLLLGLSKPPTPEDAADALAIALCHAHQLRYLKALNPGASL